MDVDRGGVNGARQDRNTGIGPRRGRPPRWVSDDTFATTSRGDLVDVLASTLLAQLLANPACVNQTGATPWNGEDTSLAFAPEQSPDGATERGRVDPAQAHRIGRTT